jgi:hypothetical protein
MSEAELIVIRTFLTRVDADLAKTALDAADIESMIRSDDAGGLRPHLWMGGVALLVRQEDAERAEAVLGNAEAPPAGGTDPEPVE